MYTNIIWKRYLRMMTIWLEAVARMCTVKKVFLENSQSSQLKTCARAFFLRTPQTWNFIKTKTLAQVFSCKFCEIFMNGFY